MSEIGIFSYANITLLGVVMNVPPSVNKEVKTWNCEINEIKYLKNVNVNVVVGIINLLSSISKFPEYSHEKGGGWGSMLLLPFVLRKKFLHLIYFDTLIIPK